MTNEYVLATNDDGDLAVRTVSATESSAVTDTNNVITRTDDGKLAIRVVGSGGGDQHNLGWYATESALTTAYPTAEAGDWAIVGATDTVWIWDTDNSAWVDSDQKGQVTSVNNQTGAVTIGINDILPTQTGYSGRVLGTDGFVAGWVEPEIVQRDTIPQADENEEGNIYQFIGTTDANYTNGYFYKCVSDGQNPATYSWTQVNVQPSVDPLPNQSGQSGKYLTTNGTTASWGSVNALQNNSTALRSISVGFVNDATTSMMATNIGFGAKANQQGTSYGAGATANNYAVALGNGASAGSNAVAVGQNCNAANQYSISIGTWTTTTANYAIQLGGGANNSWATNADANTFKVGNANGNFEMMSADGTIPADRLKNAINKYSTMPTAASTNEGWIVQFTGTTDSTYTHGYIYECVSDGGNPATYSWTAVQVQAGGGSSLPSQTGNSGKFLTTDGTDASWATINALTNNAPAGTTDSLMIDTTDTTGYNASYAISIGKGSCCSDNYGVCIGCGVTTASSGVAIGADATTLQGVAIGRGAAADGYNSSGRGVAIGLSAATRDNSIAIGYEASTGYTFAAIQLGRGTNNDEGTFKVALSPAFGTNYTNYELLSADGTVPTDRFTTTPVADGTYVPTLTISSGVATRSWAAPSGGGSSTSATATLAVNDWSSNTQTVSVQGVSSSNTILVAPAPSSNADYVSAGILCTTQSTNSLTFSCQTVPANAITVNVVILN